MKTCTKCGIPKLEIGFNDHPGTLDGLSSWCIACNREAVRLRARKRASRSTPRSGSAEPNAQAPFLGDPTP